MCTQKDLPPRQRRTLRDIISDLVRNGHLEVWKVTDKELDDATRPNIVTEKVGEDRKKTERDFFGFIYKWMF